MKIHRFIGKFELVGDQLWVNDRALLKQWGLVLRFRPGQLILLIDQTTKQEAEVEIVELNQEAARLKVLRLLPFKPESVRVVNLYCAILKKENFEWVVQKATEVGVTAIVPLRTERTIKQDLRLDRLTKIAVEATEQSGRVSVPTLALPLPFSKMLALSVVSPGLTMCFDMGSSDTKWPMVTSDQPYDLFIGPEGGWSPAELELIQSHNLPTYSLSTNVLRAETAAVVATYLAAN